MYTHAQTPVRSVPPVEVHTLKPRTQQSFRVAVSVCWVLCCVMGSSFGGMFSQKLSITFFCTI